MTTKEAVDHLVEQLNKDANYRQSWQANIAMAFCDAFGDLHLHKSVHQIANIAADNFLTVLCKDSGGG